MHARTPIDPSLPSKVRFIEHLAARLEAMDRGSVVLSPVAYRLYAKRLRSALSGLPAARLDKAMALRFPAIAEACEGRYFEAHRCLPGARGRAVRDLAQAVLESARR